MYLCNTTRRRKLASRRIPSSVAFLCDFNAASLNGNTITPRVGSPFSISGLSAANIDPSSPYSGSPTSLRLNNLPGVALPVPSQVFSGSFVFEFWYKHLASPHGYPWPSDHRPILRVGAYSNWVGFDAQRGNFIWASSGNSYGVPLARALASSYLYTQGQWAHHLVARHGSAVIVGINGTLGMQTTNSSGLDGGGISIASSTGSRDTAGGSMGGMLLSTDATRAYELTLHSGGTYTIPTTRFYP